MVSLIVPYNNYGHLEDIHIFSWTQLGELNVNRALIDFNFDEISTNTEIVKADLNLYFNPTSIYDSGSGNQGSDTIIIQRITSDWDENDVTWNQQPETTEMNQLLMAKLEGNDTNYIGIDIRNIVQDIVNEDENRFGILIRHQTEKPYNVVYFASSNHHDLNLHPKLIIEYKRK